MDPSENATPSLILELADQPVVPLPEGALWIPSLQMLVVSDLHLEKGSSYATRGQLLPPYDTRTTLGVVRTLVLKYRPAIVLSLGDSFHDRRSEARLSEEDIETVRDLTSSTDWVWVEGNHDPIPPEHLGGRAATVLRMGPFVFRHEPTGEVGEVAGHLHPCAKVRGRGSSVRRRCFVTDCQRLIMPAMGAYTGGLNVRDAAFKPLFPDGINALLMGKGRIYSVAATALVPDGGRGTSRRMTREKTLNERL